MDIKELKRKIAKLHDLAVEMQECLRGYDEDFMYDEEIETYYSIWNTIDSIEAESREIYHKLNNH